MQLCSLTVFLPLQAADIGNRAEVPLGLATSDLTTLGKLSSGTQSIVYEGRYRDQHVAIKKAKIGKSSDLDSFKMEIAMMAKLRHVSSVVSLVAARLVPPGASLLVLYSRLFTDALACPLVTIIG